MTVKKTKKVAKTKTTKKAKKITKKKAIKKSSSDKPNAFKQYPDPDWAVELLDGKPEKAQKIEDDAKELAAVWGADVVDDTQQAMREITGKALLRKVERESPHWDGVTCVFPNYPGRDSLQKVEQAAVKKGKRKDNPKKENKVHFPPIKFCPSCGSQKLRDQPDDAEGFRRRTGTDFGECASCGTHFTVSGYCEFRI